MILKAINTLLATEFDTMHDAREVLLQETFVANHVDTTRRFVEAYFGLFNNSPEEQLIGDGLRNVALLAEHGTIGLREKFYTNSVNRNIYSYENVLQGIHLKNLASEFSKLMDNERLDTQAKKLNCLNHRFEQGIKQAVAFKEFLTTSVISAKGNELIETALNKEGATDHALLDLSYFEEGLEGLVHRDFIYVALSNLLRDAYLQAGDTFTEEQMTYLHDKLQAMGNVWYNAEAQSLETATEQVSIEDVKRENLKNARGVAVRYMSIRITREFFLANIEKDSINLMQILARGVHTNHIDTISAVSVAFYSIRKLRTQFGMI